MVDALVAKAEEGRRRQRNASGSCQQMMIRWNPNGITPYRESDRIHPIYWIGR